MEERSPKAAGPPPIAQTLVQGPHVPRPSSFAFLAPAQALDEVGRLGAFRVLRLLGEGGMGLVFEAEDPTLGRRVAVKVMKPEAARHEQGRKRFLREARAAAAVEHDHVITVLQVGEQSGTPFLVMPLLKGESLERRLKQNLRLPPAEAARIGAETALGLSAAHAAGLIHRDVKPSNLWLEPPPGAAAYGGRVKVLDFGLARPVEDVDDLTGTGGLVGTAGYMAPEQARGEEVDARADLFSLGCVLYSMLTGEPPFQGPTVTAVLTRLATYDPPPPHVAEPSVPPELSELVMRLLSKEAAARPASARETADALRRVAQALLMAPTGSLPHRAAVSADTASQPSDATPVPKADTATLVPAPLEAPSVLRPRRRFATITALILAGCILLIALLLLLLLPAVRELVFSKAVPPTPVPSGGWTGFVDIVIYDPNDPHRQNRHLNDPDVLPLKPGDGVAIEAEMSPPAYLYVLWVGADGTVDPVYPWEPGDWDARPARGAGGAPAAAGGRLLPDQAVGGRDGDAGAAGAGDPVAAGRGPEGGTGHSASASAPEAGIDGLVRERRGGEKREGSYFGRLD